MSEKVKGKKLRVKSENPEIVVQFVGKKSEPPTRIINGGKTIELPSADEQRKGFAHPDAAFLLKHYRKIFKQKVKKGQNK